MEGEAIEGVGQIGEGQFGPGPRNAVGADAQGRSGSSVGNHMLDPGPDRGLGRIGPRCRDRQRLTLGLSPAGRLVSRRSAIQASLLCERQALSAHTLIPVFCRSMTWRSIRPSGWDAEVSAAARMKPWRRSMLT